MFPRHRGIEQMTKTVGLVNLLVLPQRWRCRGRSGFWLLPHVTVLDLATLKERRLNPFFPHCYQDAVTHCLYMENTSFY